MKKSKLFTLRAEQVTPQFVKVRYFYFSTLAALEKFLRKAGRRLGNIPINYIISD
jgi:hypothetical protein